MEGVWVSMGGSGALRGHVSLENPFSQSTSSPVPTHLSQVGHAVLATRGRSTNDDIAVSALKEAAAEAMQRALNATAASAMALSITREVGGWAGGGLCSALCIGVACGAHKRASCVGRGGEGDVCSTHTSLSQHPFIP